MENRDSVQSFLIEKILSLIEVIRGDSKSTIIRFVTPINNDVLEYHASFNVNITMLSSIIHDQPIDILEMILAGDYTCFIETMDKVVLKSSTYNLNTKELLEEYGLPVDPDYKVPDRLSILPILVRMAFREQGIYIGTNLTDLDDGVLRVYSYSASGLTKENLDICSEDHVDYLPEFNDTTYDKIRIYRMNKKSFICRYVEQDSSTEDYCCVVTL